MKSLKKVIFIFRRMLAIPASAAVRRATDLAARKYYIQMKALAQQLIDFQKRNFHWGLYLSLLLFLVVAIAFNFSTNFYEDYIVKGHSASMRWALASLFHMFPFMVAAMLVYFFKGEKDWIKDKGFWLRVVLVFAIAGLSQFWKPFDFLVSGLSGNEIYFARYVTLKADSLLNVVLPVILLYVFLESDQYNSFYGLRSQHWDWKPYAIMFAAMVVLIGLASFFQDLQAYYPRYLRTRGPELAAELGVSQWWTLLVYELAYGSDFIAVELFYRGVLVLAFYRYFGNYSVLIMVPAYVFLHFGKPMTEAISSAFGGYILGIISLHSRSIWGGVVLHVGVAWLMELFGWLQVLFK